MYALGNMGHPSRAEGFLLCSNGDTPDELGIEANAAVAQPTHIRHVDYLLSLHNHTSEMR
jgi:hypothetical protein